MSEEEEMRLKDRDKFAVQLKSERNVEVHPFAGEMVGSVLIKLPQELIGQKVDVVIWGTRAQERMVENGTSRT